MDAPTPFPGIDQAMAAYPAVLDFFALLVPASRTESLNSEDLLVRAFAAARSEEARLEVEENAMFLVVRNLGHHLDVRGMEAWVAGCRESAGALVAA